MVNLKKNLEKLFWLLLLASPVLDMVNGIWTYILCGGNGNMLSSLNIKDLPTMSPSFTVRMLFLVLMTVYIFLQKHWRSVIMFVTIGASWVLTVGYEFLRGAEFSLSADIQYIVRFCYCLLVLIAYSTMLKQDGRDRETLRGAVDKALCISLLISGLGVLVPYLLGMGFYTYADPLGFRGSRGFFYAGNDITAVIMLVLPLVLAGWMEQKSVKKAGYPWLQAAASSMGLMSLMIIGTKTAFLAVGATVAVLAVYALVRGFWKKEWRGVLRLAVTGVLCAAIMVTLTYGNQLVQYLKTPPAEDIPYAPPQTSSPLDTIKDSMSATQEYSEQANAETVLLSGRTGKLDLALADFKEALPFSALVGVGRGSQEKIIEMDLLEVVLYYGLLGAVLMLWLYLTQGVKVIIDLFRSFSLQNLAACVALGLCVGYLFLAGHILFSVTAGFYFAFIIVYARLFCSRDGLDTKIL